MALCEKLIKASIVKGQENMLVAPFAGSGSECVAAKKENVNFIGYELNPEYVELCNKRLDEILIIPTFLLTIWPNWHQVKTSKHSSRVPMPPGKI